MLYGDDGKMQCAACLLDFASDPIEAILSVLEMKQLRDAAISSRSPDTRQ